MERLGASPCELKVQNGGETRQNLRESSFGSRRVARRLTLLAELSRSVRLDERQRSASLVLVLSSSLDEIGCVGVAEDGNEAKIREREEESRRE